MKYTFIFQIFVIILIIIIIFTSTKRELFDAKIERINKDECGALCTKLTNCNSFSYDDVNKVCYVSKSQMLGKPLTNLYSPDYRQGLPLCNKKSQIIDPIIATNKDYKNNSIYSCISLDSTNIDYQKQKYYSYIENKETELNSLDDIEKVPLKKYKMDELEYPTYMLQVFDIDNVKNIIHNENEDKQIFLMKEMDDEFLGQYLYPHVCASNVSKNNCLNDCLLNKKCIGTEWNPVYLKLLKDKTYQLNENVCCPKIRIIERIPRRSEFKYGKFYVKSYLSEDDLKNKTNIVTLLNKHTQI